MNISRISGESWAVFAGADVIKPPPGNAEPDAGTVGVAAKVVIVGMFRRGGRCGVGDVGVVDVAAGVDCGSAAGVTTTGVVAFVVAGAGRVFAAVLEMSRRGNFIFLKRGCNRTYIPSIIINSVNASDT